MGYMAAIGARDGMLRLWQVGGPEGSPLSWHWDMGQPMDQCFTAADLTH